MTAGDKWSTNEAGMAIDGYDVVAYFTMDQALRGKSRYKATYEGATFHFANATHRDMFTKEPGKYAPKYGGHCAFAVAAKKAKVPADRKTFKIHNGQLLLFFIDLWDDKKFNTKVPWNQDEQAMYSTAEKVFCLRYFFQAAYLKPFHLAIDTIGFNN